MRAAPLGAWFRRDPGVAAAQVVLASEVTHAHPEGIAGCVAVAVAAALAAGTSSTPGEEPAPDSQAFLTATVPFAVWTAAHHLDDLTDALWATAEGFGDVDTACAITGGIVAARTGLRGVSGQWLESAEALPAWVGEKAPPAWGRRPAG